MRRCATGDRGAAAVASVSKRPLFSRQAVTAPSPTYTPMAWAPLRYAEIPATVSPPIAPVSIAVVAV